LDNFPSFFENEEEKEEEGEGEEEEEEEEEEGRGEEGGLSSTRVSRSITYPSASLIRRGRLISNGDGFTTGGETPQALEN